jgi:hypothetical protein
MFRVHQTLFSALVFAIIPSALLGATSTAVEYVGGTVKSIPANSIGTFNFDDGKQMRFNYGSTAYQLSYDEIIGTDVAKAEGHHILHKIPVPQFDPRKRKETLSIHFKNESGATETLNFELAAEQADRARDMIAIMKKGPENVLTSQKDDWWGDKYWKTNRNKAAWDAGSASNAQPAPAAPSATK